MPGRIKVDSVAGLNERVLKVPKVRYLRWYLIMEKWFLTRESASTLNEEHPSVKTDRTKRICFIFYKKTTRICIISSIARHSRRLSISRISLYPCSPNGDNSEFDQTNEWQETYQCSDVRKFCPAVANTLARRTEAVSSSYSQKTSHVLQVPDCAVGNQC